VAFQVHRKEQLCVGQREKNGHFSPKLSPRAHTDTHRDAHERKVCRPHSDANLWLQIVHKGPDWRQVNLNYTFHLADGLHLAASECMWPLAETRLGALMMTMIPSCGRRPSGLQGAV